MVLARLVQAGKQVLTPFVENVRYDLAIDEGDRFVRVQCKTGRLRKGVVIFAACSSTYHHPANQGTRVYAYNYRGEADVFGVYCPETDAVYLVPVDEVGLRRGSLRVEPTLNSQSKRIRWASGFELHPAGLAHPVEQRSCKSQAVGSSPTPGSFVGDESQRRLFGPGTTQSRTG